MNKFQRRLLPALAIFVSGGLLLPDSVLLAQGLEEIVVTARKKEENLMEVPVAVTAFSAQDLEARDMEQLTDIQLYTPSFSFTNMQGGSARNDRSSNALVFRGLSLNGNAGIFAGGQLFIDGAPVVGAYSPSIVDVERVEILKGPQTAYFGRSAFVGALNFIMKEPGDEFGATISADAARYGSHEVHVSVEGPLVEGKLAGRLSYRDWEQGGYVNNNNPQNPVDPAKLLPSVNNELGERTTQSISGTLVWTPTDNLKIKGFFNYFEDEDGPGAQFSLKQESFNGRALVGGGCDPLSAPLDPARDPTASFGRWTFGVVCGTLPSVGQVMRQDPTIFSADTVIDTILENNLFNVNPLWNVFDPGFHRKAGLKREATQAHIRADWDFGDGYTLTSLTAYHEDQSQNIIDLNYRNGLNVPNEAFFLCAVILNRAPNCRTDRNGTLLIQGKQEDFSQELRLTSPQDGRFRWTAGLNYFDAHSPGGTVYGNLFVGATFTGSIVERDVETTAVFGAAYYDITDKLTLTVEARYQEDEITENLKLGTNQMPPPTPLVLSKTFTSFAPRVSLDYKYADNSTAYVLFSRGFRPGRFNSGLGFGDPNTLALLLAAAPNATVDVDEEQLDNLEFGVKSTWLDGRARTTVAIYFDEWIDGQVGNNIAVAMGSTFNLIPVTINNGTADLKGIEFEGTWLATDNLALSATFGLNDTKLTNFPCNDCNDVWGTFTGAEGNELPGAPKVAWTLSGQYTDQLNWGRLSGFDWYARADLAHQGERHTDYTNITQTSAYDDLSLRVGIRGDHLSVEAYMLNALDHDEFIAGVHGVDLFTFGRPGGTRQNESRVSAPMPRRWGVRGTYRF